MSILSQEARRGVDRILDTASREGRFALFEHEVYGILSCLGLSVPRFLFVGDPREVDESALKAVGHKLVVKVVSALLTYLPVELNYKIILMKRPMAEVLASQNQMLKRLGRQGSTVGEAALEKIFARQLAETERRLAAWPTAELLVVEYLQALREPRAIAQTVKQFLGLPLDLEAMRQAVDPSLHRQKLSDTTAV